ncbi:transmembrane protein, putative [Medicago truncatula]|uniref:Transmembrane protein, putative n=1 Tax=Medicago truncatula TaxID=3880 RepID=G7I5L2_MEDTR|nr:transmembrane protein, putative [Medicago truncatula]
MIVAQRRENKYIRLAQTKGYAMPLANGNWLAALISNLCSMLLLLGHEKEVLTTSLSGIIYNKF